MALQRAFKLAGARQVLARLWEIPDSHETQKFLGQFCHRWLESGDARMALARHRWVFIYVVGDYSFGSMDVDFR